MKFETLIQKYYDSKTIKTEKEALVAARQDRHALKYVKDQTEKICLAAVKQYQYALQYVNSNIIEKYVNKMSEGVRLTSTSKYIREYKEKV